MSGLAREMTYQELSEAYTQRLRERDQFHAERDNCLKDIEKLRRALIKTQNLADELMEYQVKYINLTDHIRLKLEMNPSVDRYIELNNLITRLEKGE